MSVQCATRDCRTNATHRLQFIIVAPGSRIEAMGEAGLYVCRLCATQEAADAMLADEAMREQIEQGFAAKGLALPDWPRCRAVWISLPTLQ